MFTLQTDPGGRHPPDVWGYESYQTPPSDEEIGQFLRTRRWANVVRPHEASARRGGVDGTHLFRPRVTDGGVCRSAWEQVLGRDPNPQLFPDLPAEPAAPKEELREAAAEPAAAPPPAGW